VTVIVKECVESENDAEGPVRMCALTRIRRHERELLRFVASPERVMVPDIARKLPGRGVWLTASKETVAEGVRRKVFARSLKAEVTAGAELADLAETLLRKAALQSLSIANKAGQIVTGFAKVDKQLNAGRVAVLLHAIEAGEDGCTKLDRKYRAICAARGGMPVIVRAFSNAELSLALGRENVIHAVAKRAPVSENFYNQTRRWLIYSGTEPLGAPEETPGSATSQDDE
jgi:predicted RNA-binding protein YlxR (DUF448 family)